VPRQVEEVKGKRALMQDGRWVSTAMVRKVKKGDFLLVQANLAVEKVREEQVKEMKDMFEDQ
jgi:hydrogenase maturation factor